MTQTSLMRKAILNIKGVQFLKFMGSGGYSGFSIRPDFSTFVLLLAWKNEELARYHLENDSNLKNLTEATVEHWHIFLNPIHSKGEWSGIAPFEINQPVSKNSLMAVITRASIRKRKLFSFWKYVPGVSKQLYNQEGLLFAKGIGEVPLLEQATFSIWDTREFMKKFAYQGNVHREMIRKTRELDWYSEELFARFEVLDSTGTYRGSNPARLAESA